MAKTMSAGPSSPKDHARPARGSKSARSLTLLAIVLSSAAASLPAGGGARAADAASPSIYGILNPTPDDALRAFSPDRPARSTSPVTVDAGRFQIESDFLNATYARDQGTTTRSFQAADPVLKLGITSSIDFEVNFAGFNDTRTTVDHGGGTLSKGQGFGDVTLAAKVNLLGNGGGTYAFALIPYLRVPSGTRNISDGQVEGGVVAPLTIALPQDFNMTLQTEVDVLRNQNGPGTHANVVDIVNVSHAVPGIKDLTATAELYSSLDTEAHAPDVYTFDVALAYLVDPNTQVDIGANVGLNRGAPDIQAYTGIAHRF